MWNPFAAALLAVALLLPVQQASALENEDLLALVAMPLAVAAVSEITDVPMNDLIDVVTLMNDAAVPPVQFVEVVRYAPAALVYETEGPTFVEFVRLREGEGLRGVALADVIEREMVVYGLRDVDLDEPPMRIIEAIDANEFIPPLVRTRVAESRSHPHGGPPGQLKKDLGVQTGAEVVHGTKPGRDGATRATDDDRGRGNGPKVDGKGRDRSDVARGNQGKGKGRGKAQGDTGKGKGGKG